MTEPTPAMIEYYTRLAADLPDSDCCKMLWTIQNEGPRTAGAAVLRRCIAEIIALRVMVRTGIQPPQ